MIAEGVILEQEAESAGAEISVIFFQGKNNFGENTCIMDLHKFSCWTRGGVWGEQHIIDCCNLVIFCIGNQLSTYSMAKITLGKKMWLI